MTLKGILFLLNFRAWIKILHCNSSFEIKKLNKYYCYNILKSFKIYTFNWWQNISSSTWETFNASCLILQARFSLLQSSAHVSQIPDKCSPASSSNNKLFFIKSHCVNCVSLQMRAQTSFGPQVPGFDSSIPTQSITKLFSPLGKRGNLCEKWNWTTS